LSKLIKINQISLVISRKKAKYPTKFREKQNPSTNLPRGVVPKKMRRGARLISAV